jgi:hypothetical protein
MAENQPGPFSVTIPQPSQTPLKVGLVLIVEEIRRYLDLHRGE